MHTLTPAQPGLLHWWRDEIERHPVLLFWIVIFAVHAGMNAKLGHEIGGGAGIPAAFYAACFLGFAGVGAWAADKLIVDRVRQGRGLLLTLALLQLIIGQMAGWQSFGLTLSKGAGDLEAKAEQRRTTDDGLKAARAELKSLGIVRPVAAIEAEANLECSIKGRAYKDGVGPRCTALRTELETAKRKRKLEADVERLTAQLASGPAVKDAGALYDVPMGVANAVIGLFTGHSGKVGPDDVRFVWLIILVFALEFFGTFGLALVRMMGGGPSDAGSHPGRGGPRSPRGGPSGGDRMRDVVEAVVGALPQPSPMLALAGPAPAAAAPYIASASPAGAQMHGAPIQITINGSGADRHEAPAVMRVTPPEPKRAPGAATAKTARQDIPSLPADAPPVDRSAVSRDLSPAEREAADVILAFAAACLVASPGGIVDAGNIHRRYARWAGERALAEAPFLALLADVTPHRAEDIGGSPHVRGVALRAGTRLEAVA